MAVKYRSIQKFEIFNKRNNLDFGVGVYLTTKQEQAEKWAGPNGAVYVFDIDTSKLTCVEYTDEDLNLVFYLCRIELEEIAQETIEGFDSADIISGQMLDGAVRKFEIIAEKFNEGDITYDEFEKHIKIFGDKDQLCFKTQKAIDLLNQSLVARIDLGEVG